MALNVATYELGPKLVTKVSVTNVGLISFFHVRVHVNLVNMTLNVGYYGFRGRYWRLLFSLTLQASSHSTLVVTLVRLTWLIVAWPTLVIKVSVTNVGFSFASQR